MPWACGNCGAEIVRSVATYNQDGSLQRERCPHCAPELFDGAVTAPSDQKLWEGHVAMPKLYKQNSQGVYQAKDELISDTVDGWDRGPTEKAREQKRATRRTAPLTPAEQAEAERWGREVFGPAFRSMHEKCQN